MAAPTTARPVGTVSTKRVSSQLQGMVGTCPTERPVTATAIRYARARLIERTSRAPEPAFILRLAWDPRLTGVYRTSDLADADAESAGVLSLLPSLVLSARRAIADA